MYLRHPVPTREEAGATNTSVVWNHIVGDELILKTLEKGVGNKENAPELEALTSASVWNSLPGFRFSQRLRHPRPLCTGLHSPGPPWTGPLSKTCTTLSTCRVSHNHSRLLALTWLELGVNG